MRISSIVAAVSAVGLLGTAAVAQNTAGGGISASSPRGSVAGGVTAGTVDQGQKKRSKRMQPRQPRAQGSSSSTYGSGTIYTDRHRATGGVTAGGTATGSGATDSATSVDAYGSTDRNGSTGEVFGDSSANAATPKPR